MVLFLFFKNNLFLTLDNKRDNILVENSKYDILKPKFIINNNNKKILVTADEGNFMKNNNILLTNNVLFKSKNFEIYSNEVIFNKLKQTANSKSDSIFISEGTTISSKGFEILEDGNIILFNGKSKIILSK